MLARLLATAALALAALVALAWPFSAVGISALVWHPGARETSVSLYAGRLHIFSAPDPTGPRPTWREQYDVALGPAGTHVQQQQFRYQVQITSTGGRTVVGRPPLPPSGRPAPLINASIRLWWLLAGAGGVLLVWAAFPLIRRRRRRRRGRCLACGYALAGAVGADAKCPECGLAPSEARARTRLPIGRLVRDAGVLVFLALLACSAGAWSMQRADLHAAMVAQARRFDYTWYLAAAQPRLTGAVMFATPGTGPDSLGAALRNVTPGTTIVLLPGRHEFGQPRQAPVQLRDVWLVGCGREQTTLAMQLSAAERVRVEGLTIDCREESFADCREEASLYARDCLFTNYNAGHGGSTAIDAYNVVFLVEGCEFDGKTGRASASQRGTAMELRGNAYVYIRGTRFADNREVFRSADGVLDHCTVTGDQPQWGSTPQGSPLYLRATEFPQRANTPFRKMPGTIDFTESLDDAAILARLVDNPRLGAAAWTDKMANHIARTLNTARDPGFWTRLLLHPSPEVRALAAKKLDLDPPPAPSAAGAPLTLEAAIAALDNALIPRDAAVTLLSGGDAPRTFLHELAGTGSARQKSAAGALLRLMDASPTLPEVLRSQELREKK